MAASKTRRFAESPASQRRVLEETWTRLVACIPGGVAAKKYDIDCIEIDGVVVAGLKGFTEHNSYFPFSGNVVGRLGRLPTGCSSSTGALRFPLDSALSTQVIRRLVRIRLREMADVDHGKRVVTFPNGSLKAVGGMRKGSLHGPWSWYRQDGSLMRTGAFRNGIAVSTWCTYDAKGRKVSETVKGSSSTTLQRSGSRAPRVIPPRAKSPRQSAKRPGASRRRAR